MKKEDIKKSADSLKDLETKHKITEKELSEDPEKAMHNFIQNLDDNKDLRKELWNKMYGREYIKNNGRPDRLKVREAEKEWQTMNYKDKCEWFDFITDDGNALGVIGEINYISNLMKSYKGNMKRVWADLKEYGKMKKEDKNEK